MTNTTFVLMHTMPTQKCSSYKSIKLNMNFMFGKVAKKEEVKSVCVWVGGGGGHPEPNSIFEEFFSGTT